MEAAVLFIFLAECRAEVGRCITVIITILVSHFLKSIVLIASISMIMASVAITCLRLFQKGSEHGLWWLISSRLIQGWLVHTFLSDSHISAMKGEGFLI